MVYSFALIVARAGLECIGDSSGRILDVWVGEGERLSVSVEGMESRT